MICLKFPDTASVHGFRDALFTRVVSQFVTSTVLRTDGAGGLRQLREHNGPQSFEISVHKNVKIRELGPDRRQQSYDVCHRAMCIDSADDRSLQGAIPWSETTNADIKKRSTVETGVGEVCDRRAVGTAGELGGGLERCAVRGEEPKRTALPDETKQTALTSGVCFHLAELGYICHLGHLLLHEDPEGESKILRPARHAVDSLRQTGEA